MKDYLIDLIKTRTIKDSFITISGTLVNGTLGLIFYFVMARFLGPTSFGVFSVAVVTLTLVGDIANFGSDTGTVRFVGKFINKERKKALKFLKLSLKAKIISFLFVFLVGWLLTPFLVLQIFGKPELIFPLRLSLIGVGGYLLFGFSTYSLQAIQRFWVWNGLNISANALRLLIILILIYLGILNAESGLGVYIVIPFLGFLVGLRFLPKFLSVKNENEVAREFFGYNRWVAAFTVIAAVSGRLDTFLTTSLLTLKEVGVYQAAVQLASIVPQIVFALGTVVAPKLAGIKKDSQALDYLKKLQVFVFVLAALGLLLGIPLSKFVIPILYGAEYIASTTPFIVLLLAQAVFLISVPAHTAVFFYFSYPKLFFFIALGHLVIIGGLGTYLIGLYGYLGAALAVLVGNIFNLAIPVTWVILKFKKTK